VRRILALTDFANRWKTRRGITVEAAHVFAERPRRGVLKMAVERAVGGSSLVEVLDRVLDKGIVVDAWVRVSLVGIELVTIEARVVIASVDTYLRYAQAIVGTPQVARPSGVEAAGRYEQLAAELAALRAQIDAPVAPRRLEASAQNVLPKASTRTRKTAIVMDEAQAEVGRPKRRRAIAVESTPA
jgi:hypothetical protein